MRRWWEASQGEVVVCDGVRDERRVIVHLAEELAQRRVFLLWDARLEDGWVCFLGVDC